MSPKITFRKDTPQLTHLVNIRPGTFFVSWANGKRSVLQQRTSHGAVVVYTGVHSALTDYTEEAVFEIVPVEIIVG